MLQNVSKVIVACSGGADSTSLFHILQLFSIKKSFQIIIVHVNYGLRGAESDRDMNFVLTLSKDYSVPIYIKHATTAQLSDKRHSLQMNCRNIRYDFFNEIRKKTGAQRIALGHTADDNVENFLIRLLGGSGTIGLKGMEYISKNLYIRPLLNLSHKTVLDFLTNNNFSFVEDSSNFKSKYLRNKVRLELIPFMKNLFQININSAITKTLRILQEENNFLEGFVEKTFNSSGVRAKKEDITINRNFFNDLHSAIKRRLLIKCFYYFNENYRINHSFRLINTIISKAKNEGTTNFSQDINKLFVVSINRSEIRIEKKELLFLEPKKIETKRMNIPGRTVWIDNQQIIEAEFIDLKKTTINFSELSDNEVIFDFNYEEILPNLVVRSRKKGDVFSPFRFKGRIKIKKFFINQKIPRNKRNLIPLVCSGDEIIWIAGYRRSNVAIIKETTRKCLLLRLRNVDYT